MRYAMLISYDGSRYQGWQKQGNTDNTISEKIENVLSRTLDSPIRLIGAGRTDAGVHALGQTAAFDCAEEQDPGELLRALRSHLPEDISVRDIKQVPSSFHPRLSAVGKVYRYEIREAPYPDVFRRKYQWLLMEPLDLKAMCDGAAVLTGTHDFRAFSSDKRPAHSTVRTLNSLEIIRKGGTVTLTFEGNGFLYNMVRIMTGTLKEIGRGTMPVSRIGEAFESLDRTKAGATAPAKGLTLVSVLYREKIFLQESDQGFH